MTDKTMGAEAETLPPEVRRTPYEAFRSLGPVSEAKALDMKRAAADGLVPAPAVQWLVDSYLDAIDRVAARDAEVATLTRERDERGGCSRPRRATTP